MANTDHLWLGLDWNENSNEPINFIETRLHDPSPFSAHEVEIEGVVYKTAEHAYQALRVIPEMRQRVIDARSPLHAWRIAQEAKTNNQLIEHSKYELMEKIFRAKLDQHDDIKAVLKATGDRELLKVFDNDYDWGTGADMSGQNNMGKLWMKLRAELNTK